MLGDRFTAPSLLTVTEAVSCNLGLITYALYRLLVPYIPTWRVIMHAEVAQELELCVQMMSLCKTVIVTIVVTQSVERRVNKET